MPEYYVGFDLGTTNTIVSVLRRGRIETLLVEGDPVCPSVVHFSVKDGIVVGRSAKRRMHIETERTIASVKRKMGRLKYRYRQNGTEYTPADISSLILKKVKEEAEKELGVPIRKAVITVPAYFNDDQRNQTKKAAEQAGIEVLRLLSEPTAAAIAYGINQGKDQTIAVYDLGGGTFDISILQVKGNTFTVKAVGGDSKLSGDDFDQALACHVQAQFCATERIDLEKEPDGCDLRTARQRLKEECQKIKEELSVVEEAVVNITSFYKGRHLEVPVKRVQFERLIADSIARTVRLTSETLKKAGLTKSDIDRVLLVGGSTRIPYVKEKVAKAIKEPFTADNVMELVAHGAAFMAAQYMAIHDKGDAMIREIIKVSSIKELNDSLREISPYRLGIATVSIVPTRDAHRFREPRVDGRDGMSLVGGVFSEIVKLGQKIPLRERNDGYTTTADYAESVRIEIYRTSEPAAPGQDSCLDKEMQFLGEFNLGGIPVAKAGVPKITVTMAIDENGILQVQAEEKNRPGYEQKTFDLSVERDTARVDEEDGDD